MKQNAESVAWRMIKMGRQQLHIFAIAAAVLSSALSLCAAHATVPAAAPKAVTPTATTAQFSCPNCGTGSSQVNLNTTMGTMQQLSTAVLNLGGGIFNPAHVIFPTALAANVPSVTSVTPEEAQASNDAAMASATFKAPFSNSDGSPWTRKDLADFFDSQGLMPDSDSGYREAFFGDHASGPDTLKADTDFAPIFKAGSATDADNGDHS